MNRAIVFLAGVLVAGSAFAQVWSGPNLAPGNNLSDLPSPSTARTNLGLGTAATQNTGTSGGTLCLLNSSCTWGASQAFGANAITGTNFTISGGYFSATLAAPSASSSVTNTAIGLNGSFPYFYMANSGAGANAKIYDQYIDNAGVLHFRLVNDANNATTDWATITRTGFTTATTAFVGPVTATTYNGNTISTGTGTLTLGAGKTLAASNTLTLTGTDGSSVAFGAGGTVLYSAIVSVNVQTFTASGTYTQTAGTVYAQIECWGAGGGSGGAAGSATGTSSAGGGASGGYSRVRATSAQIGASQVVTIGAGGIAGATGNNPGGTGGNTSVGALCVANGGGGGGGAAAGAGGISGTPGAAGTGDIKATGNAGGAGIGAAITTISAVGGAGAPSIRLGGSPAESTASAGCTAGMAGVANSGAGASGGVCQGSASTAAGAQGGSGYVAIFEYRTQ